MNDTCSGCRDAEGFTYVEERLVFEPATGSCTRVWVNRCRKESTCEKFKKVKEFKMKDICDGCIDFSDGSGFEGRDILGNKYPLPKFEGQHCVKEDTCERFQRARERRYDMVDSWAYAEKVSKEREKEFKMEEEKKVTQDNVNHPSHYADGCSLECIDVMEAVFGPEIVFDYAIVNAFKYLWRYKNKNGQEDIRKAEWYLDKAHDLDNKEDLVGSRRDKYWAVRELYFKVRDKERGKEDGEVQ